MSRVMVFDEFGGPEILHNVTDPTVAPAVGEVRVAVEDFAVNTFDAMMRGGTSPGTVRLPHARLGIKGTGVIDALGADVTGFDVGDPVIITAIPDAVVRRSYAEHTNVPAGNIITRPPGLDVTQSAGIWVAFATAYGSLGELAHAQRGDRLLIAGASGAVGRMAMQIVNLIGATPIALTRSAAKSDELLSAGASHVIATDGQDAIEPVRAFTGGAGADVVLNLVRGPGQRELVAAVQSAHSWPPRSSSRTGSRRYA